MTRLVLAVLIVAALMLGLAVLVLGYRALAGEASVARDDGNGMQKLAYALLVGLMLYVALQGGV